jgi:hypothetical protein
MSNLLRQEALRRVVMAAKQPRLGLNHPTVVPTNFQAKRPAPSDDDEGGDDATDES